MSSVFLVTTFASLNDKLAVMMMFFFLAFYVVMIALLTGAIKNYIKHYDG